MWRKEVLATIPQKSGTSDNPDDVPAARAPTGGDRRHQQQQTAENGSDGGDDERETVILDGARGRRACLGSAVWLTQPAQALQTRARTSSATIKTFDELFMEQVKIGDALVPWRPGDRKKMNVTLSTTGMACAMCHPFAADTHPAQYPKWQEQMSKFAALRDMINWCIEKPNQGEVIDTDGPAMKALEAYITWSNKNSPLAAGTH